jgi:hypothetical protein
MEEENEPGMVLPQIEPGAQPIVIVSPTQEWMDTYSNLAEKQAIAQSNIRLTPENAKHYIGRNILFRTRSTQIIKKILGVSPSGKSIRIDHSELKNNLEIVSRNVYIIQ